MAFMVLVALAIVFLSDNHLGKKNKTKNSFRGFDFWFCRS